MAIRTPRFMDFEWVEPGNDQIGFYSGEILDTFKSSSPPLIRVTYHPEYLPQDRMMEIMSTVNRNGKGQHSVRLYLPGRDGRPQINGLTKVDLITSRSGNILTLNESLYTGTWQAGDWLNVGLKCMFINTVHPVNNNVITVHNMHSTFDDLNDNSVCSTEVYQMVAKREGFGYGYSQRSLKKFQAQPVTYREVT